MPPKLKIKKNKIKIYGCIFKSVQNILILKGGCLIQIIYDRIKIAWEKFFVNITFNR